MKKIYSLYIIDKQVFVVGFLQKRKRYKIEETLDIDREKLSEYLKDKKNFYVITSIDEVINEQIKIPKNLKKESLIRSFILKKFKDTLSSRKVLLNYKKIAIDEESDSIVYEVDAIDEKEYTKELLNIPDWLQIKCASIEKFALLALCRQCFQTKKGEGFFAVHVYANSIMTLAIDSDYKIVFERLTKINVAFDEIHTYVAEDINQTISYVKHQFREKQFSTILLGGAYSGDDLLAEQLLIATSLGVGVLYPNTFIEGLENEEYQNHIIAIGALFVKKEEMFLPQKAKSLYQYDIASKILLTIASISFINVNYFLIESFFKYQDELDRYEMIKSKLIHLVHNTKTYPLKKLELSLEHVQTAEKYLSNHPLDLFIKLRPLFNKLSFEHLSYRIDEENRVHFSILFQKQFTSLEKLYTFQKEFRSLFDKLNEKKDMELKDKTAYAKMLFQVTISNVEKASKKRSHKRGRRRR